MKSLKRWNRSYLPQYRYVDGNAVTYFHALKKQYQQKLLRQADAKSGCETSESLVQDYLNRGTDWGLELLRAYAKAAHVVCTHLNENANELSVPTAQQWDSLRKFGHMVHYQPAPPASAQTFVSLKVKKSSPQPLPAGILITTAPDSGAQIPFETRQPVQVDASLNQFYPAQYQENQDILRGSTLWLQGNHKELKNGEPIFITDTQNKIRHAAILTSYVNKSQETQISIHPPVPQSAGIIKGCCTIHYKPEIKTPVTGPGCAGALLKHSIMLKEKHDLKKGEIITISDGSNTRFAVVKSVAPKRISVYGNPKDTNVLGTFDLSKTYISRALEVSISSAQSRKNYIHVFKIPGDYTWLAGQPIADIQWMGKNPKFSIIEGAKVTSVDYHPPGKEDSDSQSGYSYLRVTHAGTPHLIQNPQRILLKSRVSSWKADSFLDQLSNPKAPYHFETSEALNQEDWAVIRYHNQLAWGCLQSIESPQDDLYRCQFDQCESWGGGLFFLGDTCVYSAFTQTARCKDWNLNQTPLKLDQISLDNPDLHCLLQKGQPLFLEHQQQYYLARITEKNAQTFSLTIEQGNPPLLTIGQTVFHGNVCKIFHGKTQKAKTFSSGENKTPWLALELQESQISFLPNAQFSNGVMADLEVKIDQVTWTQVEHFKNSEPDDLHYQVELQGNGKIKIVFGDDQRGKMVPPGSNNICVTYRCGQGLQGNVAAHSLSKIPQHSGWITSILHPLAAYGGSNRESEDSIRSHIANKLTILNRAISVEDFAKLASFHSSVWKAKATLQGNPSLRNKRIHLIVVPAGGTSLSEDLRHSLETFILQHSLPGTTLHISRYQDLIPQITIQTYAQSAHYDFDSLRSTIQSAIYEHLNLEKRELGQGISIGELYQIVENISGIEHSLIQIHPNITHMNAVLTIQSNQIAHLPNQHSNLRVSVEEYQP